MGDQDSRPRWRKSSFSGTGGNCLEVACAGRTIRVRDSNSPELSELTFPDPAWAEFIAGLRG
ncbi:DUF397 domain-containing protein [Streptomyces morookaense]|uniref:DUF397 domain-containing protein n=1 Tax=Streptomyces morookaense TaxID=1970 RepID=A0A7Y7BB51_STRMO|nr:DUF397 domain-containing protein [Streptomyces morookaense]NVK82372.1 DUF397 domain-containing protein [Streptomyces morookaense]